MNESSISMLKHWMEPAHPGIVRLHDDLLDIYQFIRKEYQTKFDEVFDKVARAVGYVVTTSVPLTLEVKDGTVHGARMGAEHLKGTMFEELLRPLQGAKMPKVAAGTFNIYVIWFDALKLKLKADWMEPAHFLSDRIINVLQQQVFGKTRPDIREPAHWFDPGIAISEVDAVQIAALDSVYPELFLAKHVATYRERLRATITPGVREPAHFHLDPSRLVQPRHVAE